MGVIFSTARNSCGNPISHQPPLRRDCAVLVMGSQPPTRCARNCGVGRPHPMGLRPVICVVFSATFTIFTQVYFEVRLRALFWERLLLFFAEAGRSKHVIFRIGRQSNRGASRFFAMHHAAFRVLSVNGFAWFLAVEGRTSAPLECEENVQNTRSEGHT